MILINPIDVTNFTTNLLENEYSAYVAGTTYAVDNRVIVASEHNVYESLVASNIGNAPSTSPTKWALVGKTNAYKCIDDKVSSQTINATSIVMEFSTLKATSIGFLNVECESIKVEVIDGVETIFTETRSGFTRVTDSYFNWFFNTPTYQDFFYFVIPFCPTAKFKITLTGALCKVGVMVAGISLDIGATLWDSGVGFIDYSKKVEDEWGEVYLQEGNFRKTFRGSCAIETSKLSTILNALIARRGKTTLYIPTDVYNMSIFGYASEPDIVWQNPVKSIYNIDITGVI